MTCFKTKNMRIKEFNHVKIYKVFKFFMHFYFSSLFHIIHNIKDPQNPHKQNNKYTPKNKGQNHSKNYIFKTTFMHQNSRIKSHHNFHKNITKSAQINKTRTHIFLKQVSTCNCIPKTSIKCQKLITTTSQDFRNSYQDLNKKSTHGINKRPKYFSHVVIKI
jgi:hypothetical protein